MAQTALAATPLRPQLNQLLGELCPGLHIKLPKHFVQVILDRKSVV